MGEWVGLALKAGAAGILIGAEGCSPFEREAVAASDGAVFKFPVKVADAGQILRCLKAGDFFLLGLGDEASPAIGIPAGRRALVVPGPAGLDGFWRKACDRLVAQSATGGLALLAESSSEKA